MLFPAFEAFNFFFFNAFIFNRKRYHGDGLKFYENNFQVLKKRKNVRTSAQ